MKKMIFSQITVVLLFCLSGFFLNAEAQETEPLPCLTNYRIPLNNKGVLIGKVVFPGQKEDPVVLLKDTAKLFRIDKTGSLRLRKHKQIKTYSPVFRYGITVCAGEEIAEFELVKDEFIHNGVIAHRGAWAHHPGSQNSLSSLKSAIRIGCEGSEFDVRLSSDGEVIISHDASIKGVFMEKSSAAKIQKVPLENGDFVPTLKQYIIECRKQNKTNLVLEIKESDLGIERTIELTDKVVAIVHKMKAQGWVEYISFSYESLKEIRRLDATAELAVLSENTIKQLISDGMSGIDYNTGCFFKDKSLIERAHKVGLSVNVWTITSPKDIYFFYTQKVDKITTNEPETLICLYRSKN